MRFRTLNSNSRARFVVCGGLVLLVRYLMATLTSSTTMPVKPIELRAAEFAASATPRVHSEGSLFSQVGPTR
jgi:hypothetical protein